MKKLLTVLSLVSALLAMPACTATQTAAVASGVKADLASPAGKAVIADLFSSATSITVAALGQGTNLQADIAAADSLGSLLEAYSTLPTTSAHLSTLATTAASTSSSVTKAAPQIVALIDSAKKNGVDPVVAIQTVASGVYAATGIPPAASTIPAAQPAP